MEQSLGGLPRESWGCQEPRPWLTECSAPAPRTSAGEPAEAGPAGCSPHCRARPPGLHALARPGRPARLAPPAPDGPVPPTPSLPWLCAQGGPAVGLFPFHTQGDRETEAQAGSLTGWGQTGSGQLCCVSEATCSVCPGGGEPGCSAGSSLTLAGWAGWREPKERKLGPGQLDL